MNKLHLTKPDYSRSNEPVNIAKLRTALNAEKYGYTDEDLLLIHDFLSRLAEIDYSIFQEQVQRKRSAIVNINSIQHEAEQFRKAG